MLVRLTRLNDAETSPDVTEEPELFIMCRKVYMRYMMGTICCFTCFSFQEGGTEI